MNNHGIIVQDQATGKYKAWQKGRKDREFDTLEEAQAYAECRSNVTISSNQPTSTGNTYTVFDGKTEHEFHNPEDAEKFARQIGLVKAENEAWSMTFDGQMRIIDAAGNERATIEKQPYSEFVASRFKGPEETARDLALCSGKEAQFLHATAGMAGEWYEYKTSNSRQNALEELGDFWFFYQAGAQVLGVEGMDMVRVVPTNAGVTDYSRECRRVEKYVGHFLDIAKKAAIYRKPFDSKDSHGQAEYRMLGLALLTVAHVHGFTIEQLEETNRAKLTKRYQNGYSNEAAQARADKA